MSERRPDRELTSDGERVHVTLVFSDLCDYTALNEINDPEESDSLRRRLEREVKRVVQQHGGQLTQCYGDGTLAVFGLLQPAEDDARRAVEAALDVHEAVRAMHFSGATPPGFELRMHTGIHAGIVFVRTGDTLHGRYELTGDAVNLAARLSSAAERDQVLVSTSTLSGVESFFTTEPARDLRLKGKRALVRVSPVTGRSRVSTRFEARTRGGLTPLVGRTEELGSLEREFEQSKDRAGRLVVVKGVSGIGKSRLLEELRRRATESGAVVLSGGCDSYGELAPLEPFLQMLRQLFALHTDTSPRDAAARVSDWLDDHGLQQHSATFLRLLSLAPPERPRWSTAVTTLATLRALESLLSHLHEAAPVLVLLDDWQWADETSRSVLRFLTRCQSYRRGRVCVVVSMREGQDAAEGLRPHTTLTVSPLSEADSKSIVGELRAGDLDVRLAKMLHELSGGNPLFLEELSHSLTQDVLSGQHVLEHADIPNTLQGVIGAHVASLPLEVMRTLQVASVVGLEISDALLTQIEQRPCSAALDRLVTEGLIFPLRDAGNYRFKHGIVREVVYETVRISERHRLHERIANALEAALAAGDVVDHSVSLAFHYRGSDQHERAARFAEIAGDKAAAVSFLAPARAHYSAALASLETLPMTTDLQKRWLSISAKWSAQSAYAPGRSDLQILARSVAHAIELGDLNAQAHNSHMLGWFYYALGEYRQSLTHYTQAHSLARQLQDDKLLSQTLSTIGQAYGAAGDYRDALEYISRGLEQKRARAIQPEAKRSPSGRAIQYSHALSFRSIVYADLGDFERALADIHEAADIVRGTGHAMEPSVLMHQCIVQLRRGSWPDAAKTAAHTIKLSERVGSAYVHATSIAFENYARCKLKPSPVFVTQIKHAVDWLQSSELRLYISFVYAQLADAALAVGDTSLAHDAATRALVRASEGDPHGRISAQRTLATLARRTLKSAHVVEQHLGLALDFAHSLESKRELALTSLTALQLGVGSGLMSRLLSGPRLLHELERMGMAFYANQARELPALFESRASV